jgi:cytochrome c peroxidase
MWIRSLLLVSLVEAATMPVIAHAQVPIPDPPANFSSLKHVPVPEPAALGNFVRDRASAIALGKALFWDTQIGSDGQACASCHFHAGADNRLKNQLNPGLLAGDTGFGATGSGGAGGPNYTLRASDFPFHRLSDPTNRSSTVTYDTNDVASSQGTFDGGFVSTEPLILPDVCNTPDRAVFQVGGKAVRKVEPRNTPTVINAAFNFRNFWDGRANNIFNGASPFGRRDVNARIMEVQANGTLAPIVVALENSSLASQAVGPPVSDFEMSCLGRGFADIGRKMYARLPLALQAVALTDSVLGLLRDPLGKGLHLSYRQLVEQAFQPKYWSSSQTVMIQGAPYSLEEANFSLFWGLAIQLYEETLVSDDAPIDRYFDGDQSALTAQEKRGFDIFQNKGKCAACHAGPELTGAASRLQAENQQNGLVERMVMGDNNVALYDNGFYNTGVRPTIEDRGVGGTDPFGNPLSFTRQFKRSLQGHSMLDPFQVDPCTFAVNPCVPVTDPTYRDAVDGAFKTPSLRNAELTGPYFHNGGQATLEQVVDFYNRGGDRRGPDGNDTTGLGPNGSNLDADIEPLGLTAQEKADLVAFLKRPLTDDRVRWEKAPFDHPELLVPHGHVGDEHLVTDLNLDNKADDTLVLVPAVGAGGRLPLVQGPLSPFLQ